MEEVIKKLIDFENALKREIIDSIDDFYAPHAFYDELKQTFIEFKKLFKKELKETISDPVDLAEDIKGFRMWREDNCFEIISTLRDWLGVE